MRGTISAYPEPTRPLLANATLQRRRNLVHMFTAKTQYSLPDVQRYFQEHLIVQSGCVNAASIVRLAARRQGRLLRNSTVTVLASSAGGFLWLHAGAIHCRWRELRIVAKTRQPQNQEFCASTAKRINVGMLRATFDFRRLRNSCFLCASLTPVIQKIIVTIKTA